MATIGLRDLFYAKITETTTQEEVTTVAYAIPDRLAKAITADLAINYNEASLYADDGVDENFKEFKSGTLTINMNDISPTHSAYLLGQSLGEDGVTFATVNDSPPHVAIGFRSKKSNGKYRYIWLYKVKFAVPAESYATKGENIEFKTPTLEGTIVMNDKGQWKADYTGEEDGSIAQAWFTKVKESV